MQLNAAALHRYHCEAIMIQFMPVNKDSLIDSALNANDLVYGVFSDTSDTTEEINYFFKSLCSVVYNVG